MNECRWCAFGVLRGYVLCVSYVNVLSLVPRLGRSFGGEGQILYVRYDNAHNTREIQMHAVQKLYLPRFPFFVPQDCVRGEARSTESQRQWTAEDGAPTLFFSRAPSSRPG